jgi:hypothetical protein
VALSVLLVTAIKRFGWKWATIICAVGCTLALERQRRHERIRALQQRALRRARMQQMWHQDTVLMLIRDPNGVISPVRPSHLALMLREDDFTAEDYETLLALDQEIPRVKDMRAAQDTIAKIPSTSLEQNMQENCCICLEQMKKGEIIKTMTCNKHVFHAKCLDEWLSVKGSCPLCLSEVASEKLVATS